MGNKLNNTLSKVQRLLGKRRKRVFFWGILFVILPILTYVWLYRNGKFDYGVAIGLYYSIFSVLLGLVVFLELQDKKVSENNEDFMNILISLIDTADKNVTIYSPNVNIGQLKVPQRYQVYKAILNKFLEKKDTKLTFYAKKYQKGDFITSFDTSEDLDSSDSKSQGKSVQDNKKGIGMIEFIKKLANNEPDEKKAIYFKEVNHLLIDLNNEKVDFKIGTDEIFDTNLFAIFNENRLFFGVYSEDEGDIKGETFTSDSAINSMKKLLKI